MGKAAILLFGISYLEQYSHWHRSHTHPYIIDYQHSYQNYQTHIFDYFKQMGYECDVFLATNESNKKEELVKDYQPVRITFPENTGSSVRSRNSKVTSVVESCLNYCTENNEEYDLVLLTRFDLWFKKDFQTANIQLDKLNLVSKLEKGDLICDNFYLFPGKVLQQFLVVLRKNAKRSHHKILGQFMEICEVNFILGGRRKIHQIPFYDIVRQKVD